MNDLRRVRFLLLSTLLGLVACGGGGSSPPPPAPPPSGGNPPPPQNDPPTFLASTPAETVFEGRDIEIRARDIDDPDGDAVHMEFTQVSGPEARWLTSLVGDKPTHWFEAPEVTTPGGTETLIFEVSGNDSTNDAVVKQVTITVRDDDKPGLAVAHIDPEIRLFAEQYSSYNNRRPTNAVNLLEPNGLEADISELMYGNNDSFSSYGEPFATIQYHPDDIVLYDPLWFNGVTRPSGPDFIVLSQDRDALEWYTSEYTYDDDGFITGTRMFLQQSEDFVDPCTVVERTSTGNDFAWVGLREGGVVVTEVVPVTVDGIIENFDMTRLQTLGADRSLCFIFPTELPRRFDPANVINIRPGVIAVDYLNKELLLIADTDSDGIWEELEVVPLDLGGNADLEIVDAIASGSPSLVPRWIGILVSDGVDGGDHRLIIVSQNDDLEIEQDSIQWSGGAPIKLLRGPFAGDASELFDLAGNQFRQDLAVVSGSATGTVLFRDIKYPLPVAEVPIFSQPQPIPFLDGASSAITVTYSSDSADPDSYPRFGIIATFPDDQSLRFFGLREE